MPNTQNSTEITESQSPAPSSGNHVNQTTQNSGPIDPTIKINPSRLRRLEESTTASSNITPSTRNTSTTSIASSATLYAPSVSGTTLQDTESEPQPRTFKTGHGVCCNPDLMKRCLEHGEVEGEGEGEGEKVGGGSKGGEVIDRLVSGYTGPTDTQPKTEEERVAGRERVKARLARIQ